MTVLHTTLDLTGMPTNYGAIVGLLRQNRTSDMWLIGQNFVLKWYHGYQDETPELLHTNIVPILEKGNLYNRYFEIYPYIPHTLETKPVTEACFMRKIPPAVEYIHQAGYLHCDLQPKNILVSMENELYICDFGSLRVGTHPRPWAKRQNRFAAPQTSTSTVSAETDWYSVEQIRLYLKERTLQ